VQARTQRAQIKAKLRAGSLTVAQVLQRRQDPIVHRLRLREVLTSLPRVGAARAELLAEACGIELERRLGQIGDMQAKRLLAVLASIAPDPAGSHEIRGTRSASGPRLVVLSGPSGVGKSSVVAYLREHYPQLWFSVSVTTRSARSGEHDGVDYFFISEDEFERLREESELLEWATFSGHSYGTPAGPVQSRLAEGRSVICEIELQGARQIRAVDPNALLVFLAPPTWEVLVARLQGRGTEAHHVVAERLATAREELAAQGEFDVIVVNENVADAAAAIMALLAG